jgi:hypothetical protein
MIRAEVLSQNVGCCKAAKSCAQNKNSLTHAGVIEALGKNFLGMYVLYRYGAEGKRNFYKG